jgi:HlyD family secretion protein
VKIADTSGQDVLLAPNNKHKTKFYIALGVALTLVAIFLVAPSLSRWSNAEVTISAKRLRTAVVEHGDFIRDLSIQGRVVAAVSPKLYSPTQGTITYHVDAGDSVNKDQILAIIDSPELTNSLQQEESTLQRLQMDWDRKKIQAKKQTLENQKKVDLAKIALTAAEREKRRADQAYESHSISQIDYEKAQDDLENATLVFKHANSDAQLNEETLDFEVQAQKLQVTRQQLLVEELKRKVSQLSVISPVNGIVGNLATQQKEQVAQNQQILSVVDLSEFELEVAIPESYADDLAIGMDAEITLNGETHLANLVTISPEIENNQVTGRVRFTSSNKQQNLGLRQNQRLTTRILLENKNDVLMVQRGQFLESGNGKIAYVINDGVAHRRAINTGARSLSKVEIVSGLKAGDQIIVSGTDIFSGAENVLITQ